MEVENKGTGILPPLTERNKQAVQPPPQSENTPETVADTTKISPESRGEQTANSSISLGLDDPKTGAPDRTRDPNRHPDRGRDIYVPLFAFGDNGPELVNPLPVSGLSTNEDGLVLEGTPTNPSRIFSSVDAPHQAVAALYDHLSEKYPNLEASVLWRLAKVGTFVAIDVPLMVAAHEMGHGAALADGSPDASSTVVLTGWMSGYTSYDIPDDLIRDEKTRLFTSVAGMNQATYQGEEVMRRMHTEGADVADAISYLVNITNNMNYQMKDWIKHSDPGYNDAATYHAMMESRQNGWNQENLSMLSVGINLLNADFWASLIGTVNYIATGEQVRMPEVRVGDAHISLPHFSLINTYEGPQLNTSIFGHLNGPETLELKYSQILTPDNGPALGLEARLHNLMIPNTNDQLSLSPRLGFSTYEGQLGFKVGSAVEYRPNNNKHLAITMGVDYRQNYLPDLYLPNTGGVQVEGGVKFNF